MKTISISIASLIILLTTTLYANNHLKRCLSTINKEIVIISKIESHKTSVTPENKKWLVINSVPEGALVFINNVSSGKTPMLTELNIGTYSIKLSMENYYDYLEEVTLDEQIERKDLTVVLKSKFSSLKINTLPDINAIVIINGEPTNYITPCLISNLTAGVKTIQLSHDSYVNNIFEISIAEGETIEKTIEMLPLTGTLKIVTTPFDADIYLNQEHVGKTPKTFNNLKIGDYDLKLTKDYHKSIALKINIINNETTDVHEILDDKMEVSLKSIPSKSEFLLNNQIHDRTPSTQSLKLGPNSILFTVPGYNNIPLSFVVSEDHPEITFKLQMDTLKMAEYNYNKFKKQKYIWLGVTTVAAVSAVYFNYKADNNYSKYPNATHDASSLHNKIVLQDKIWKSSAAIFVFGSFTSIINALRQKKMKKLLDIRVEPVEKGLIIGLKSNF